MRRAVKMMRPMIARAAMIQLRTSRPVGDFVIPLN